VLRRFSIDGAGTKVFVFDKARSASYPSAIRDAGSEKHFNTLEIEGQRLSFEKLFQAADDQLAELLEKITSARSVAGLTGRDREGLADVIAVQLIRTKLVRTSMRSVVEDLGRSLSDIGLDPEAVEGFVIPSEQDVRRAAVQTLLERDQFREALRNKDVVLFELTGQIRLWTSDNPVALYNSAPHGEVGLAARGVEIYLPIAPDLVLALLCPSIGLQLRIRQDAVASLPDDAQANIAAIARGIATGEPIRQGDETARALNGMQVSGSSRFLYSASDEFDFAREMLESHPDLKEVRTSMRMGRLGEGLPRRSTMPPGRWLILQGHLIDHVLSVDEPREDSPFIEVTTSSIGALEAALIDQPLVQAQVYEDGRPRRHMREIRLEVLDDAMPRRIRIVHNDDGLNQLVSGIRGEGCLDGWQGQHRRRWRCIYAGPRQVHYGVE
jgi:hypothetical protein